MRILITNDDGINAPGIIKLAEMLEKKHQVTVVAPDTEKSASSHSITLTTPLRITEQQPGRYAVSGSPADSVILALQVIVKQECDVVISGINSGPNLGEDIMYSGTVAAAMEAMYYGIPAIAVSLCSKLKDRYQTAAHYIAELLDRGILAEIKQGEILNINVPAVAVDEIKGFKVTKTGKRVYENFVTEQYDQRNRKIYWLGGDKPQWMEEEGTDIEAIRHNFISITPLSPDFTNKTASARLKNWFENK